MTKNELLDEVVEVAKIVSIEDEIDFGMLSVDEETAYRMIASSMIELHGLTLDHVDVTLLSLLGTVTHLGVKNMVLEAKLLLHAQKEF